MTTTDTSTNRAAGIADFITATAHAALAGKRNVAELSEQMQEASAAATNARQALMQTIADTANTEQWSPKEIDSALAIAPKRFNDGVARKTFSTMISEIRLAADPDVRVAFSLLVRVRDHAWAMEEQEAAAAKKAEMTPDTPLKLAFARAYHVLVAMMRRVADPPKGAPVQPFHSAADLVEYARSRDPRRDPEKIAKQIEGLVKNLRAFHDVFPVDTIKTLVDYAELITAAELKTELEELAERQANEAARAAAEEAQLLGDPAEFAGDGAATAEEGKQAEPNDPEPVPAPVVMDDIDVMLAAA